MAEVPTNTTVAEGTKRVKKGMPAMLKGGVIMDVMNKEQAKIAEEAGACAVMALERIPADIRQSKGVARMSDPKMIKDVCFFSPTAMKICGDSMRQSQSRLK